MGPIVTLFNFTMRQTLLSRKIWLTVLLLAAPCALLILIRVFEPDEQGGKALWEMYHVSAQFFLLSGLVPIVCLVHGVSLIGSEVEARTFPYLITRRMRRATVLIVKFAATALVLAVLSDLAMLAIHLSVTVGRDLPSILARYGYDHWDVSAGLRCYLLVIPMGAVGFLAVFNLIGLTTSRPMSVSIVLFVIFELTLSNLPLTARAYSLSHQLRVSIANVMPEVRNLYELPDNLIDVLYPAGASAMPALIGIIAVALAAAALLVTLRELMPEKVAHE